jgi:hypothetical protein
MTSTQPHQEAPGVADVPLPVQEYRRRLAQRQGALEETGLADARFSRLRLMTFATTVALIVAAWNALVPWWAVAAPIAAFFVLVVRHERVIRAQAAAARAVELYERGLARIDDRWAGTGEDGSRFSDPGHLYAADLDLFGHGSLFQLLCTARTAAGEETLARWLLHPAAVDEIEARHAAVTELTGALDFREALAIAGAGVRTGVQSDALVAWAESPSGLGHRAWRVLTILAPLTTLAAIPLSFAAGDLRVFFTAAAVQTAIGMWQMRTTVRVCAAAAGAARDLEVFSDLLDRLQRERFRSDRLLGLRGQLDTGGLTATQSVRRVLRFVELYEWQQNPLFAPVAGLLLWGANLAWLIEAWRQQHGPHVRAWLAAAGEFEALASLAAYRYEHPSDPFPTLLRDTTARFDGAGLRHPLLPAAAAVPNDVQLTDTVRLFVVSGSNMSGKSTLLRTVGINAVLALAGAPVRAASLHLTPLAVGATLRIQDSLQEGRSRFYAEITRVRALAGIADGPLPLLFLLDELFHGTNSHDRVAGAAGVLRSLLRKGAIGLVTTHDLAVAAVTEALAPQAVNVHFEDWLDGTEMRFDYRMKPGPVRRSNALALMRAAGLRVQESDSP